MESFTVQCTSCQSRIRVRNPKMIGQIANCPKCSSMILISAPQQITVESSNATDSIAVTREALPTPDPQAFENFDNITFDQAFRSDGLKSPNANSGLTPAERNSVDNSLANSLPDSLDDDLPQLAPENFEGLSLGNWMPEPTAPPRSGEQVVSAVEALRAKRLEAFNKQRQMLIIAAIGLCSILVAGGTLFLFLKLFRAPKATTAQSNAAPSKPATTPPVVNPPTDNTPSDSAAPADAVPTTAEPSAPSTDASATSATGSDATAAAPTTANANATPSTDATPTGVASGAPLPSTTTTTAPGAPMAGSIAPSIDAVFGSPSANSAATTPATTELPPGLMSFAAIFDQSLEPALPDASVPVDKAPEVTEDAAAKSAVGKNAAPPSPATLSKDLDKRLKTELRGLRIDKRPLSDSIIALASAGDFPIVADLDALSVGGHEINPVIEFTSAEPIALGEAITKISAQSGISFDPWDNQALIVRPTSQWISEHVPASLPISDLVTSAEETQTLLAAMRTLLPELTAAIQSENGMLTTTLDDQNQLTWYQVARLLESWRVARGIANAQSAMIVPASSRLPQWPTEIQKQAAASKCKYFLPAEPLARSWQRLCGESSLVCWIDWYGLKASDLSPTQVGSVITQGRPLTDILQTYARKYDLVFAIENDKSIWITSAMMHRTQPRLYVLPMGDKSLEDWRTELEPLAPIDPSTGATQLIIVPTTDGKHLFVRCCRPILVGP